MGFKLDDMMSAYTDFARGYLFYASITKPGTALDRKHPYLVESASLPAQSIAPISTNWQGNEYKIGGTNTFADFTVNFKSDTAQKLRSDFLIWMNQIHDPVSNIHGTPGSANGYFGQVDLTQIDVKGVPVMSYSLVGAWPSNVTEIALDYGSKEISKFSVTFTYQYHTISNVTTGTPARPASV